MARIGFDARMIDRTGIGTYVTELLPRLPQELGDNDELVVFAGRGDVDRIGAWLRPVDRVVAVPARIYGPEEQLLLRLTYRRSRLALLHAPHYNQPIRLRLRTVLTINDVIPLVFPHLSGITNAVNRLLLRSHVRRAARLIAPSAYTAGELTNRLGIDPWRIAVIPDAAGPQYGPQHDEAAERSWLPRLGITPPYLLYAGQWKPYKNVLLLIEAFSELSREQPSLQLVIGGREDPRFPQVMAAARANPRIVVPGWLPAEALPHLFRAAAVFVMPSLYEGFGLPVLEAMASGTPVVSSRLTSLPEVAGDAALYWDDDSGRQGLVQAMRTALEPDTARRLRTAGLAQAARFSWDQTAARTAEVYRSLVS